MPLFECLMNSNSKSLLLEFQIELCWCWCILEIWRSMTMLLSPAICPSVSGADILRQFLVFSSLLSCPCREDVWVPGSLTDIHCSQIQIGPIKHSRQKTALIKDSQQSFNVNFLLFLTDSRTLKCPWRPWNLKYIGANFNIVALAWVSTSLGSFIATWHRALEIFLKPQKSLFSFMFTSHSCLGLSTNNTIYKSMR